MQPKISIIVPVYKVEKYLARCMQTLQSQTLREIEIILVDDQSPDNCPQLCDVYAQSDERVKVIHKKNGGLGFARNSGLDIASGEYVMFVDSDDTIEIDSCECFYRAACEYKADIVVGNFNIEVQPGIWHKTDQPEGLIVLQGDDVRQYMLDMIATAPHEKKERLYPVSVCISCIKRSLIEENKLRFYSEKEVASEDTIFKTQLLKHVKTLVRLPKAFYSYHLDNTSLTHTFNIDKFYKLKIMHAMLKKELEEDKEAELRIDRFIISDARIHFLKLVSSDSNKKIQLIKQMMNDDIWKQIKVFKPSYFPMYQRIFYLLTIWKMSYTLYTYSKFITALKNRKK